MRGLSSTFAVTLFVVGCSGASNEESTPVDNDAGADTFVASDSAPFDTGSGVDVSPDASTTCGCTEYTAPSTVGSVPAVLDETSGLVASRNNAGVLYANNDSGDTARIFALDSKGEELGQINIGGATAVDWEDIALGPCATTGTCVWIGDVGDNGKSRTNYALYSIPEPALDGKPFATMTIDAQKFPFAYPDGKWNCETLLVHPTTGAIFLVTKDSGIDGGVYRFPAKLEPTVSVTLEKVGSAYGTRGSLVTGGDVSPCGDRVLLRTYGALFEYTIPAGKGVADALAVAPRNVPVAMEGQGESVAYRADGRGYFTASEGSLVPLSLTNCR
jgi:hypothetical protein